MKKRVVGIFVFVVSAALTFAGCDSMTLPKLTASNASGQEQSSQFISVGVPVGPTSAKVNETLSYTISVQSNLAGSPTYGFYWGDGSYTWTSSAISSHAWNDSGVYTIRVQARYGDMASEWSAGKIVMVGTARLSRSPLGRPEDAKQYITPSDTEVKTLVATLLSSEWSKSYGRFDAIREWVATRIKYSSDATVHQASDYWQFPIETIECGTGDCEDLSILLCTLLRASGVPQDDVYVVIGAREGTNEYHAYVLERFDTGYWRMIEPQIDYSTSALSFQFFDWMLLSDYSSDIYCFNDQDFFYGLPTLTSGIYEEVLPYNFWPFTGGASVEYWRNLKVDEKVEGMVEWLGDDNIYFQWSITVTGPGDAVVLEWNGKDIQHDFTFLPAKTGIYTIKIIKRDIFSRGVRLMINPSDWEIDN